MRSSAATILLARLMAPAVVLGALLLVTAPALAAKPPAVVSESVSGVREDSTILNATVNPHEQDTTYHFQYGTTTEYGTDIPIPGADIGSGSTQVVVGDQVSNLEAGVTYHYRILLTYLNANKEPVTVEGEDQTFTTSTPLPPTVATGPPAAIAQNTATVTGTVDPDGTQTWYELDFGSDTAYGTRIFGDAGSSAEPQSLVLTVEGLAPNTTYHYRLTATNSIASVYGADEAFTTTGYPTSLIASPIAPALIPTPFITTTITTKTSTVRATRTAHTARHKRRKITTRKHGKHLAARQTQTMKGTRAK